MLNFNHAQPIKVLYEGHMIYYIMWPIFIGGVTENLVYKIPYRRVRAWPSECATESH